MHRRLSLIVLLVSFLTLPLSAAQFIDLPFDRVVRESSLIVRGTIGETWTAWDDAREVIYTYATVRVSRYFGEATGPDTLVIREVGGTVDGYTQEAIGFPAIRQGEDAVLMLAPWNHGAEYRIHAFNQGKFLVRMRAGAEVLIEDPLKQGDVGAEHGGRFTPRVDALGDDVPALRLDEFSAMVEAARAGEPIERVFNRETEGGRP